jgi:hypothetical protein
LLAGRRSRPDILIGTYDGIGGRNLRESQSDREGTMDDETDARNPAAGIILGCMIGTLVWMVLLAVVMIILRS